MMFKSTRIIALAAALASDTHAAAVDGGSKLEARQPQPCPTNGFACGWYLLGGTGGVSCSTEAELRALNNTVNPWDSIYQVNATGDPVAFVRECRTGCSQQGNGISSTTCN